MGNVRVSFDKSPTTNVAEVVQEDEYYAFGLRHGLVDNSNDNRYLYNGKEYQKDLKDQYDYGARFYDPVIGRWTSVDPLAEQDRRWSPYNYTFGDPIRFTDPDGMWPDWGEIKKNVTASVNSFTTHVDKALSGVAKLLTNPEPFMKQDAVETVNNAIVQGSMAIGRASRTLNEGTNEQKSALAGAAAAEITMLALPEGDIAKAGEVGRSTEVVQRAMSNAELEATQSTGLLRGGREGTHHVSDAIGNNANKVRQRLALGSTPDVKVTMDVPAGIFSNPSRIDPFNNMPGGGMERTATGQIPILIRNIKKLN